VFVSSRRDVHGNQMLMADYSIAYSFVHIIDSSYRDEEGLRYLRCCACYQKTILARFCELLADATTANAQLTSLSHRFRRSNCQTSSVWRRKRRSMWSSNFRSDAAFGGLTCRIVFLSIFSIYIFSLSVCVAARSGRLSNARESSGIHPLQSRHYCLGLNFRAGARGGNE